MKKIYLAGLLLAFTLLAGCNTQITNIGAYTPFNSYKYTKLDGPLTYRGKTYYVYQAIRISSDPDRKDVPVYILKKNKVSISSTDKGRGNLSVCKRSSGSKSKCVRTFKKKIDISIDGDPEEGSDEED